ncbi:MAG: beta strand repeat-containing protein [Candidatus Acidiferrales bacterium]
MKPKHSIVVLLALALAGTFGLAACGGGGGGGGIVTPPPHNGLTVLPGTASVPAGGTAQFSAFVNDVAVNPTWTASSGTITSAGVFTAPTSGTVTITGTSGTNSGTATVNIVAATTLSVTPAAVALPAGQVFTFTAMSGGAQVAATWTATATGGGFAGTVDNNGNYTPPIAPPPGSTVTITASSGGNTATSNVQVIYGNGSLPAQTSYAFSYTGDDGSGYLSVAGSFAVDGNGTVTGGVEDGIDLTGNFAQTVINGGGTYAVGPDGRVAVAVNTSQGAAEFQFALAAADSNGRAHGVMIRFDNTATGSGTIDEQNPADFALSALTGPYVFSTSGADANFAPLAIAGKFWTNSTGFFPQAGTTAILDANDGGTSTSGAPDTTLTGSLALDPNFLSFGRGFFIFSSGTSGQIRYAFYVVDRTHLKVVEIDTNAFTNGDVYSGQPAPLNGFQVGNFPAGNYAFTTGGTSTNGAYVAGGVFVSDGKGNVSKGIFDNNDNGQRKQTAATITSCPYTIDSATGRIAATLSTNSGSCTNPSTFAVYQTSSNTAVMLELDSNPVSSGLAYFQSTLTAPPAGSYALNITGQGFFKNQPSSFQQDASGQVNLTGTGFGSGTIDLNNFGSTATFVVNTTTSTFAAPDSTFGRGQIKLVLSASSSPTYNLFYYMVDPNTMLLMDIDSNRIANGIVERQF